MQGTDKRITPPHGDRLRIRLRPDDPSTWSGIYHCYPGHWFVYRLFSSDGSLLYVGITWSAKARWAKHRAKKPWWSQVSLAQVECFDGEREALAAEMEAIRDERPRFNIRGAVR
jgi:predicted GIY-YIG superfamily endonuclease